MNHSETIVKPLISQLSYLGGPIPVAKWLTDGYQLRIQDLSQLCSYLDDLWWYGQNPMAIWRSGGPPSVLSWFQNKDCVTIGLSWYIIYLLNINSIFIYIYISLMISSIFSILLTILPTGVFWRSFPCRVVFARPFEVTKQRKEMEKKSRLSADQVVQLSKVMAPRTGDDPGRSMEERFRADRRSKYIGMYVIWL